jgi:myo-inositol-1(or 4)-monophosphatase
MSEMEKDQLESLVCKAIKIVTDTGDFIRNEVGKVRRGDIEEKSLHSLVSYVDRTAEEQLVSGLADILPGSAFLTEEATIAQLHGTYRWVIDPLDGTTNFLHQLPCFAVSVALQEQGHTILGIVLEVNRKECFYAWRGAGAYLNGARISVSDTGNLRDSLVATGFPYHDFTKVRPYFEVMEGLMRDTRGLRRYGAAAVDLAWVACGRFDAFFEYALSPWDVAAGNFLVQEAGGVITDFRGADACDDGREILAANPRLHGLFLDRVKNAFY